MTNEQPNNMNENFGAYRKLNDIDTRLKHDPNEVGIFFL